ncbi:hypothetical protein PHISCL_06050 [Aspergillus sclerotialis]|uniref:Uncharacterized protein n=1 Tax=Aspergillus sclerotialis TaxID=2070753 RepID=A0A3A2ZUE6_9EURO|nr:hypothetical protein PHISCL_06050 [Aspergillus sclerotialis]
MDPIIRDYENLFRLFYNYPPIVNSVNIATAYSECKALLALADMYDALPVTGPRVDHHLLGFGSRLFKQIAKYPPSYLKLGYLARSRVIFSEASSTSSDNGRQLSLTYKAHLTLASQKPSSISSRTKSMT